jgi:hypothetical protein
MIWPERSACIRRITECGSVTKAYVGFRDLVYASKQIGFTDTFFYYLLGEAMSVEEALYETIDLRYGSHTNRCEKVRAQGNSPTECRIPPR